MKVIFYSTHCPKCEILKSKLDKKQIGYEEINDVNNMVAKGFTYAPILEVDGQVMEFKEANDWVNKQ